LLEAILARLFPPVPQRLADVRLGRRALVRGHVVPRDLIESPLTGERCIYYRYLVEEWRPGTMPLPVAPQASGFWAVVDQDEAIAEFYLSDQSGRAVIGVERARVELAPTIRAEPHRLPGDRRATELRIGANDLVEVEGMAEAIDDLLDEGIGYRDPSSKLLLRAIDGGVLRIRVIARAEQA
jgi:hypothetical protein